MHPLKRWLFPICRYLLLTMHRRSFQIGAFFLLAQASWACLCFEPGPACQVFKKGYAVFTGRVTSIKPIPDSAGTAGVKQNVINLDVMESFTPGIGREFQVYSGDWDCDFRFEAGQDYVVWAEEKNGKPSARICSRTRALREADEDLAYLRSIPSLGDRSWIYGTAKEYTHDPAFAPKLDKPRINEDDLYSLAPMKEVALWVIDKSNNGRYVGVAPDGSFRIDVPPGEYKVHLGQSSCNDCCGMGVTCPDPFADRWISPGREVDTKVVADGCSEINFRVTLDGRISGVALMGDGSPYSGSVELVDPKFPNRIGGGMNTFAEDGKFMFYGVPPGEYYLGLNLTSVNKDAVRTYYPGVESVGGAELIKLGKAEKIKDLVLRVRRPSPKP
jgi:hypothetical protein